MPDIDAGAKLIAEWINYSWDGLREGSIKDRGYPEWAFNGIGHLQFQGGKEDLRELARKVAEPLRRRIAELEAENKRLREALSAIVEHKMLGVDQGVPSWREKIEAARAALSREEKTCA